MACNITKQTSTKHNADTTMDEGGVPCSPRSPTPTHHEEPQSEAKGAGAVFGTPLTLHIARIIGADTEALVDPISSSCSAGLASGQEVLMSREKGFTFGAVVEELNHLREKCLKKINRAVGRPCTRANRKEHATAMEVPSGPSNCNSCGSHWINCNMPPDTCVFLRAEGTIFDDPDHDHDHDHDVRRVKKKVVFTS